MIRDNIKTIGMASSTLPLTLTLARSDSKHHNREMLIEVEMEPSLSSLNISSQNLDASNTDNLKQGQYNQQTTE